MPAAILTAIVGFCSALLGWAAAEWRAYRRTRKEAKVAVEVLAAALWQVHVQLEEFCKREVSGGEDASRSPKPLHEHVP